MTTLSEIRRREFLQTAAVSLVTAAEASSAKDQGVFIIVDPTDPVASSDSVKWAVGRLQSSIIAKGGAVRRVRTVSEAGATGTRILVAGAASEAGQLAQ